MVFWIKKHYEETIDTTQETTSYRNVSLWADSGDGYGYFYVGF